MVTLITAIDGDPGLYQVSLAVSQIWPKRVIILTIDILIVITATNHLYFR